MVCAWYARSAKIVNFVINFVLGIVVCFLFFVYNENFFAHSSLDVGHHDEVVDPCRKLLSGH